MPENNGVLTGRRIGVFGKGGAGKSTVVVLLARALQKRGYEVCVLDADSTNVGLPQALGFEQSPTSLMDYYGGMVFSGGLVTCPVDDPMPLVGAEISLDEFPHQYYAQNQGGITLMIAGKIGDQGPGAGCDGPVSKIARDVRISGRNKPPVTLIDFKAGFEDAARGVITGLDWAIVVVDPTTAAIEMAENMRDMVNQIKADVLPATAHLESPELVEWANRLFTEATIRGVVFVLNRVQDAEIESYLVERLAERDIESSGIIHEDHDISISWLKGSPVETLQASVEAQKVIDKLEKEESKR